MKALIMMTLILMNFSVFSKEQGKNKIVKLPKAIIKTCPHINGRGCIPQIQVGKKFLPIVKNTMPKVLQRALYNSSDSEQLLQVDYLEGLVSYERGHSDYSDEYQFVFRMLMHEPRAEVSLCNTGNCKPEVFFNGKKYRLDVSTLPIRYENLLAQNVLGIKADLKGYVVKRASNYSQDYDVEYFVISDMSLRQKKARKISSSKHSNNDLQVRATTELLDQMINE